MRTSSGARERFELVAGAWALPRGLLWLERSRTLIAADAHFGYEEIIGGALPLWSTAESLRVLLQALESTGSRELVLLGDIIHGASLSEGAAGVIGAALARLRERAALTLIAGNHEGKTRGVAVLGDTEAAVTRDGWRLSHGDRTQLGARNIIGHLHPSLPLGGDASFPAFLAGERLIVVPALTPYSSGLRIWSPECVDAIRSWGTNPSELCVVASGPERVYPFGSLTRLRTALAPRQPHGRGGFQRKFLRPD